MSTSTVENPVAQQHSSSWHSMTQSDALSRLESQLEGLSGNEVQARQGRDGKNILPSQKKASVWFILLSQFLNPLIYILLAAAVASVAIGEYKDAVFILLIIGFNAALGGFQEFKAEKSAEGLQNLLKIKARVIRNNQEALIDAEQLVVGDVVLLESGGKIPADARLLQSNNLSVDESLLTGESQSIEKAPDALVDEETVIAERINMVFAGSSVISGRAQVVITAIGQGTEIGKIAQSVKETGKTKTPLMERMEHFSTRVAFIVVGVSVLLGILATVQGHPAHDVFFMAVALAVAAIPEGLPIAMTVALSIGSRRMAQKNVIVRRLMAIEGLGSCTAIASDKTGTLTLNKQTVRLMSLLDGYSVQATGEGYNGDGQLQEGKWFLGQQAHKQAELGSDLSSDVLASLQWPLAAALLCNDGKLNQENNQWSHDGDPVDVALLAFCYKAGLVPHEEQKRYVLRAKIPYESERQFAAQFYEKNGSLEVAVKGAAEKLIPYFDRMLTSSGVVPFDKSQVEQLANQLAEEGYRVLAVAGGSVDKASVPSEPGESDLPRLTLLALVGMIDPLRPEVPQAIEHCHQAGVRVVMVTGDHPETAFAIASELGIASDKKEVVTGMSLAKLGQDETPELLETVRSASVFARVTPLQKLQIVKAMQKNGHFVAVTGDGANDTPALQAANIGVAMGTGSDIAKDAASIVVTDDNFASIVGGIEEGRFAYDNVRKVIFLLTSTNAALVFLVTGSLILDLALPFHAVQLLWLNVVTNGIQDVALAFEAGDSDSLKRPPRDPQDGIFDRIMIQQNLVAAAVIGLVTLAAWIWLVQGSGYSEAYARNLLLLLVVLMQNIHAFNVRSETRSVFKIPFSNNWILIFGIIAAQGLHMGAMHVPFFQDLLGIEPVKPMEWFSLLGASVILLLAMELFKLVKRKQLAQEGVRL